MCAHIIYIYIPRYLSSPSPHNKLRLSHIFHNLSSVLMDRVCMEYSGRREQETNARHKKLKLIIFLQLHLQSDLEIHSSHIKTGFCCCSVQCRHYTTFNFQFHNFFYFSSLPSSFPFLCVSLGVNKLLSIYLNYLYAQMRGTRLGWG